MSTRPKPVTTIVLFGNPPYSVSLNGRIDIVTDSEGSTWYRGDGRVNAFGALVAVAKAAIEIDPGPITQDEWFILQDAVRALDASHPGWRDWTP